MKFHDVTDYIAAGAIVLACVILGVCLGISITYTVGHIAIH